MKKPSKLLDLAPARLAVAVIRTAADAAREHMVLAIQSGAEPSKTVTSTAWEAFHCEYPKEDYVRDDYSLALSIFAQTYEEVISGSLASCFHSLEKLRQDMRAKGLASG